MNPCNIPIIVLPGTSSPADIRRAIDTNNQTVATSDGKKSKCKSRKSFADFNLASLPYKVLFIFGVIVVLLQKNNTSSNLEVSRNGRSLGAYSHDDSYEYYGSGRKWEDEEDMYNLRMRGRDENDGDEKNREHRSDADDKRTFHDMKPAPAYDDEKDDKRTFHDMKPAPAYDDEKDDKSKIIHDNKPVPPKPDGDEKNKEHRSDADDKRTFHDMKPAPAYDDEKDDKSKIIHDNKPVPPKPDGDEKNKEHRSDADDKRTFHDMKPAPAYDDEKDDKSKIIHDNKPVPPKPDGDDPGKGDGHNVVPSPDVPDDDPTNPPATTAAPRTPGGDKHDDRHDDKDNVIKIIKTHKIEPDDEHDDDRRYDRHDDRHYDDRRFDRHDDRHDDDRRFDRHDDDRRYDKHDDRHYDDRRFDRHDDRRFDRHDDRRYDRHDDDRHYDKHDDRHDDKDNVIKIIKTHKIEPDDEHDDDRRYDRHDDRHYDDRRFDRHDDRHDDDRHYDDRRFDRHDDGSHPNHRGRRVGVTGAMSQGPDPRGDRRGDEREFRNYDERGRNLDDRRGRNRYDDFNGLDEFGGYYNRRFRRGDDSSAHYDRFNSMRYEGDFSQGSRGGRMRNENPFSVPRDRRDDVNGPRKSHDSRPPRGNPEDDPRQFPNSRGPMEREDEFEDGRNRRMRAGPQGDEGRRDERGRDRRLDMEEDRFNSREDFMRRSADGRRGQVGRDVHGRPEGDDERLPFGCTQAELEEQMTEEELNRRIQNLRPNATVKEMFVLFNQILSFERKKFVKTQEYIMRYSQYLQKTLLLPTPIRMKYWWRAHYNMTEELIKKERGDFQDFYAFVNRGPCQKWDFLYFVNAKRKSWEELSDLMKSVWMEILTYKMKKHSKL
ncbi:Plasmodium exported protein, unknown function [Plasmodium knowlesi strain H]|uniref:Plasmodium RESA N-terminal domain-containing protein n=3 Tax=Plasmodium knowlesi TaxID=5850 RepID=A0A5E7WT90_PLAKH|nr:Plasmodium exported protein (PHIST), unknown function [Plasmodium knowlesi strain H]OTN68748.1 Uncharacterized protein PKNOH_S01026300 [Plasmodium knowlesi]CAA9986258.1 Plasmodium exported protein (PHIST), unknown function [Plasmodium knowlesi strain H]SBO25469.1 Plasmodium exported protein, unknown function [Plasmodium knowlesi strain H]SBO27747.1 Plasmodium exported protein, unknown function [Plasmodium knowlesi strain H]VVS75732.1 Plasmodium exported protein (PHIST), unknown function [Pl